MAAPTAPFPIQRSHSPVYLFTEADDRHEVLQFLAQHLPHTVVMSGLIRDNGFVSSANRGNFHGYRDETGELTGVALIGHATFVDTRADTALAAFAEMAQRSQAIHMILGEEKLINRFWSYFSIAKRQSRLRLTQLLFEQTAASGSTRVLSTLRLATLADLDLIVPIHAQLAFAESGVDPREKDAKGFIERCAQRIQKGRVWVWREGSTLIFKADVASALAESTYIEGAYIDPQLRGKGLGLHCLTELGNILLQHTKALHALVNEKNQAAQALLRRSGYRLRDRYETIFLKTLANNLK
jgi:predicted GNAT family acetyltransferase